MLGQMRGRGWGRMIAACSADERSTQLQQGLVIGGRRWQLIDGDQASSLAVGDIFAPGFVGRRTFSGAFAFQSEIPDVGRYCAGFGVIRAKCVVDAHRRGSQGDRTMAISVPIESPFRSSEQGIIKRIRARQAEHFKSLSLLNSLVKLKRIGAITQPEIPPHLRASVRQLEGRKESIWRA